MEKFPYIVFNLKGKTMLSGHKNSCEATSFIKNHDEYLHNRLSLIKRAKKGVDAGNISLLYQYYNFKKNFIADMLDLSTKTLDRYTSENRKLNPNDSELIIKLILLYKKGIEVFSDQPSFLQWLNSPAYGLGKITPVDIITTSDGIDLIIEELNRIEFGDIS